MNSDGSYSEDRGLLNQNEPQAAGQMNLQVIDFLAKPGYASATIRHADVRSKVTF
jgi:hypothetical protein